VYVFFTYNTTSTNAFKITIITIIINIDFTIIKFREYLPIVTRKGFSLKLKGKVIATCVRSCLMHGSETWPMKVEHELKMNCTEMSMIRRMCGV